MHFHPVQPGNLRLKHLAFAIVLGAGVSHGQTVIDVGGAGIIGDTTLTTSGGTAKLSVGGDTWKTNGGTGAPVSTTLASPAVVVPASGIVTLTFTHRYDFESGWDGGAVFVSVNGNPAVYLDGTAFSSNGYVGTTTTGDGSAAWSGGENVFYGQSADYSTPALITSVADLGSLTAGDTVSVQFKGEWDDQQVNGPPAWEIGSVKLTDAGATDFLDVDFAADGPSGFSVSNSGALPGPWTYNAGALRFELDADADTADRIKPDIAGSTIDLNNATIRVVLLNGEVEVNDTFSLFDLSGGTTLTGSLGSITLPAVGTWDTSELAAGGNGTITLLTSDIADGTWITDASGNWSDTSNWLDEIYANGRGKTAHINLDITGNRTVTIDTQSRTVGTLNVGDPDDTWSGGAPIDGDANGDGVSNGLAFLLGAVSPAADATGLMPTITEAGGGLDIATFSMLNAASRGSATLSVEHSSSLATGSWTSVAVPDTAGETTVGAVTFHVTLATPPSVLNTVTATISPAAAAGGKLFGRLKAENP